MNRKVDKAAEEQADNGTYINREQIHGFLEGVSFANSKDNERILCAAMLMKDGEVIPCYRHYYAFYKKVGFLTSKGRFVDRKEAAKIAWDMGQIDKEVDELTSEDLY